MVKSGLEMGQTLFQHCILRFDLLSLSCFIIDLSLCVEASLVKPALEICFEQPVFVSQSENALFQLLSLCDCLGIRSSL